MGNRLVPLASLLLILYNVLLLQLTHALNLIQIDHETLLISMKWLDTLSAKNGEMIRTVKMLDSLGVLFAKFLTERVFILIVKVERQRVQNWILFHHLVQDVDIKG